MIKVLHLIHDPGVGGVQTIAAELSEADLHHLDYRVGSFSGSPVGSPALLAPRYVGQGVNRPGSYRSLLKAIRAERPDVLLCSLWRSVLVGLVAKVTMPRLRLVVFLHNSVYTHRVDALVHRIALKTADAVLCDGEASRSAVRRSMRRRAQAHVLPLLAARTPVAGPPRSDVLRLVYWGRLAEQKRIDRALGLVRELVDAAGVPVEFRVIGPDDGAETSLRRLSRDLGLDDVVRWLGPMTAQQIAAEAASSQFFLQLSDFEGHGLSVVEAMQFGLVPVVTPVGDVGAHTTHLVDAVQVDDLAVAAAEVSAVWSDPDRWSAMSARAVQRWEQGETLVDSFSGLCEQIVVGGGVR